MHCCITFAVCSSCLFPLRPSKRRKGKTRPKAFILIGGCRVAVEEQHTKLFNICRRSKLNRKAVKERIKCMRVYMCVDVGNILLFSLDTNRILEHYSLLLFRLVICNMLSVWNFLQSKRIMNLRLRCVKIKLMIYSFNMPWPRRRSLEIWFFNHFLDQSLNYSMRKTKLSVETVSLSFPSQSKSVHESRRAMKMWSN